MKSAFGLGKNIPNTSESIPFTQTNERKTVPLNTRAIKLYDYLEIYGLEADRSVTNISTNLYIYKQSGKIKEGNENLKGEMNEFSAFLGIMNVMGANFLVLVKDVAVHFVLDGREKIFEVCSVEFKELANPQEPSKITKEIKEFLSLIEKILSSGGFYFSYKYPLTLSQQKISEQKEIYSEKQRQQSVQKLVDYDYMWNYSLMKTLIQQRVSADWQVQLIQGHVYNLIGYMPNITYFTLISRRQTRRAGTRQNHRGIDSDGFVANCVETEQIFMIPGISVVISHVQIRGSVPCFWKQRGVASKILIDPSKQLQIQACKLHLDYLAKNYTQTTCVNLMNASNHNEKKLIEEFQTLVRDCISQRADVQYKEFDFHQEVKGDRLESVDIFIRNSGVMKNLSVYGYFSRDFSGAVLSKQSGIVRTNCLDCLDRTNFFQLRVGFLTLKQLILSQLNLVFKIGTEDKFLKDYSTCWNENGDKISWHYAGSDASSASASKSGKQGVFGFLKGKISSAKRFFQGGEMDSNKQQCYCFLLGEHYETQENLVFQEELQKQMKLRENQFTKKRKITIFAVTWNVGAFVPEKTTQKFPALFWHNEKYDIVVFGLQELVELKPKNLMMSTSQKHNAQKEWQEIIQYNLGKEYFLVTSSNMVGVQTYIFAKTNLNGSISDIETDTVKCGFGGQLGNKGAVAIKLQIYDTSFAFLNCHLPAGQSKIIDRVNSLHQCIYQSFQQQGISSYKKDPLMRADKIIILGDLNFRVERKYADTVSALERILSLRKDFELDEAQAMMEEQVTQFDQLQTLMKGAQVLGTFSQSSLESFASMAEKDNNSARSSQRSQGVQSYLDQGHLGKSGCLHFFYEKKIRFLPTYKFDVDTDVYDTSKKQRVPSYCDRILICDNENENYQIENCYLAYESCPSLLHSDHKPVFAVIQFSAKQIDCEARDLIEEEIVKAEENIEEGDVIFQEKQTSVYDSAYLDKNEIEQLKSDLVQDIMIIQHEKDQQEEDDQGELEDEVVEGSTIGPIPPGLVRNGTDPFELSPGNSNMRNTSKSSHKMNSKKSVHTSVHNGQTPQQSQYSQQSSNRFHYDSVMIGHQAFSERFQGETTNFNDEDTRYQQEEELKECTTIKLQPLQNTVYQGHKHLQQFAEFAAQSPPPPPQLQLKSQPQPQSLGYQQLSPPPPSLSFLSPPPPSQVFQSPPPLTVSNTSIKPYQRQQASVGIKENNYFNLSQMGSPGSSSSDLPQMSKNYERTQLAQNNNNNISSNNNNSTFHFQQQQKQLNNYNNNSAQQHNYKPSSSPRQQLEHGQVFGKTFRTEPISNNLTSSLTESSMISNNYQSELQTDSIFNYKR